MSRSPATVVRYSEAFKRQVVEGLEDGTFRSIREAQLRYGIVGNSTIERWLKRYGRLDLMAKVVRVERPEERDQLKELKKRVQDLEHALAETRMRELLLEGHYLALCEDVGIKDPEVLKKKQPAAPSPKRGKRASRKGGSR